MAAPTFPTNGTTNGHTTGGSSADEAIDSLYAWMPPQAVPQPCPEALFSVTLKGCIDGHETLLTARGMAAAEFKANLEAIRGLLDTPVPPVSQGPTQGQGETPQCEAHGALKRSTKGKGWYCAHKLDDGTWCPSKGR